MQYKRKIKTNEVRQIVVAETKTNLNSKVVMLIINSNQMFSTSILGLGLRN